MMIGDILQPTHLIFVLVIALLVLGPKRLPEVGRSLGRGLHDFRNALSGDERQQETVAETAADQTATASAPSAAAPPPVESPAPAPAPAESAPAAPAGTAPAAPAPVESAPPAATAPADSATPETVPAEHVG
jgi:sec-independent protein translocase protein TatA